MVANTDKDEELPVDLTQLKPIPIRKSLLLVNNFVSNSTRFLNHFSAICEEKLANISNDLTRLEISLAILEAKLNSIPELEKKSNEIQQQQNAPSIDIPTEVSMVEILPPPPPVPPVDFSEINREPSSNQMEVPPPPIAPEIQDQNALTIAPIVVPPPPSFPTAIVDAIEPPQPPVLFDIEVEPENPLILPSQDLTLHDAPPPPPAPAASLEPQVMKIKDDPLYSKYFKMRSLGMPEGAIAQKMMLDGVGADILNMDPESPSPNAIQSNNDSSSQEVATPPPPPPKLESIPFSLKSNSSSESDSDFDSD